MASILNVMRLKLSICLAGTEFLSVVTYSIEFHGPSKIVSLMTLNNMAKFFVISACFFATKLARRFCRSIQKFEPAQAHLG